MCRVCMWSLLIRGFAVLGGHFHAGRSPAGLLSHQHRRGRIGERSMSYKQSGVSDLKVERNERWFTDIYHANYRRMLAYARRRVDSATADEVVADTFLVAWRRRDSVPEGTETAWLYGVAKNTISTALRAASRRTALANKVRSTRSIAPEWEHEIAGDDATGLLACLKRLRDNDREILMLAAWEGLSNAEIAASFGISVNAVAIRLHRARNRLLTELAGLSLGAAA